MQKICKSCKEMNLNTPIHGSVTFKSIRETRTVPSFFVSLDLCPDCEEEVFGKFVEANAHYGSIVIEI